MSDEPEIPEIVEQVHYEVESKHQTLGMTCTCGYSSNVSRDHTRHIVTATLVAAGLEEPEELEGKSDED